MRPVVRIRISIRLSGDRNSYSDSATAVPPTQGANAKISITLFNSGFMPAIFLSRFQTRSNSGQPQVDRSIVKTDIPDHRPNQFFVCRELAVLHRAAKQVAQDAPEILVARIRHEGARVGDHAYESRQQSAVRQRVELPLDAFLLIEKPPAAAKLQFAGNTAILEIANHGRKNVVVVGVGVVNDHPRQLPSLVKTVEICGQGFRLRPVTDRIEARVPAHHLKHASVRISIRAEVQLFGPTSFRVEGPEEKHQKARKSSRLRRRHFLARPGSVEDLFSFALRAGIDEAIIQSVVGESAAALVKVVVALAQGVQEA